MTLPKPFKTVQSNRLKTILQGVETPALVYLYDPDANLCQLIEPEVSELCQEKLTGVDCLALNVQENKDITFELKVTKAPSFVFIHRGEEIRRMTSIDYDESFKTRFNIFLTGDFLFEDKNFNRLEEMNFFSQLQAWHQFNLVAFMETIDPINWQLESSLAGLYEKNLNFIRLHLVNATKNEPLLGHYDLKYLPAVILFEETGEVKRWHPASDPMTILSDCEDLIAQKTSG